MYNATMIAQIGPLGSPASAPKIIYRKGSAVMIDPPGAPGDATIATPSVMMNGITVARLIGSWFIMQTAVAQAVIVIIEPHMWMFAQRGTTKLRISALMPSCSAHLRLTGIVACVAGYLVDDELDGIFAADCSGYEELYHDVAQVHSNHDEEHFPEDAENGEGLS